MVDANWVYACFAYGQGDTSLGLLHKDSHCDALTSVPALFDKRYFCPQCFQAHEHAGQHACQNNQTNHCLVCRQTLRANTEEVEAEADDVFIPPLHVFFDIESMQVE